jgi:hypothetical protein
LKTKRWHFVNLDIAKEDLETGIADSCTLTDEGDCIVYALSREIVQLSDRAAPLIVRQNALRFVVHLVGDMSQPFHCAEHLNDGGGNGLKVDFSGKYPDGKQLDFSGSLHKLWDDVLIDAHSFSWGNYVDEIETTTIPYLTSRDLQYDRTADCHDAGKKAYAALPTGWETKAAAGDSVALDTKYQQSVQSMLSRQLAVGGLALAAVLNKALGE